MALNLTFYDRGPASLNDLTFGGFDGSRAIISQSVTSDGAGAFASSFTYDALSPGAHPQENLTVVSTGTTTSGALKVTSQLSMTRAASQAAGAVIIGGTLAYDQQTDGSATQGSGTGTLNISDSGVQHTYDFELSLIQTGQQVTVTPPVFDASTGMSTATQDGPISGAGCVRREFVRSRPADSAISGDLRDPFQLTRARTGAVRIMRILRAQTPDANI